MNNLEEFEQLKNGYVQEPELRQIVVSKLCEDGTMTRRDASTFFKYNTDITQWNPSVLCIIYKTIKKYDKIRSLPSVAHFFNHKEIEDSKVLLARAAASAYPVKFEGAVRLSSNEEYLLCLTAQQIYDLSTSKLLRIRSDMQRESEIINYQGVGVPCVKFSMKKMKEIKENLLEGKQFMTTVRIHLIPDLDQDKPSFEFDDNTQTVTINSGLMANIDGNHRIQAIVSAVEENHNIAAAYRIPVILTVGTPMIAREVIIQDEKRTPISTEHTKSMENSEGKRIIFLLKANDELRDYVQFSTTTEQFSAGSGYFVEYIFADAFDKCFDASKGFTKSEREDIAEYLGEFLVKYFIFLKKKHPTYMKTYTAKHRQEACVMSSIYASYVLVSMAAQLRDYSNWDDRLERIVNNMNSFEAIKGVAGRESRWAISFGVRLCNKDFRDNPDPK